MAETTTESSSEPIPSSPRRRTGRRSPNFPYVDLPTAIERARQLYAHENRNSAPADVVAAHWNYSPTSSSTDKVLGALNAYGLIASEGAGAERTVRLTSRALDIIEDERDDSPERESAIRAAALDPAIFSEIRREYGGQLPSDATLRTWLVRQRNFNQRSANAVIANYRATIGIANLDLERGNADNGQGQQESDSEDDSEFAPGSKVQWMSQDVAQFPEGPRELIRTEEHAGELYGVVLQPDGTEGFFPMSEAQIASPETADRPIALPPKLMVPTAASPATPGVKSDTYSIGSGQATITWPEKLTADECSDLEYFLNGVLRKAKRAVTDNHSNPED
ncbi:MAG: hypothetical protein AAGG38_13925 [Planctomycetota bacterium]